MLGNTLKTTENMTVTVNYSSYYMILQFLGFFIIVPGTRYFFVPIQLGSKEETPQICLF